MTAPDKLAAVVERARALGVDVDDPANAVVLAAVARIPETSAEANTRLRAMAAEVERVNGLASEPAAKRAASVWCARCGRGHVRSAPGVVLETPDGLLLAVDQPVSYIIPSEDGSDLVPASPSEVRAAGRHPSRLRGGWLLDGPHTWARIFGPHGYPRHAGPGAVTEDGHIPSVQCGTHGTLRPDVAALVAGVRSGWRAVGVAEDGTVSKIGGGR